MEQITETEKKELALLIENNGLNNDLFLERIIHQDITLLPDASEIEIENRIMASVKNRMHRSVQQHRLRLRILRYAAVIVPFVMLTTGLYIATHLPRLDHKSSITSLDGKATFEYPSGVEIALSDHTNLSVIMQEDTVQYTAVEEHFYKIKVPRGVIHIATLEDGTTVHLFPESELRFSSLFSRINRSVELSGEGYFNVVHDNAHPFTVFASGASITVLGTSFNVRAYEREKVVETSLVSGKVEINEMVLLPNQMALFNCIDHSMNIEEINGEIYRERAEGVFAFDNRTLDEIMYDLSLWFDFDYSYAEDALRYKKFRFKLPRTENFNRLIDLMKCTDEVDFKISGKHVEILPIQR